MKKLLLFTLGLFALTASAQTEIEPFAPTVPGTYIGDFSPFTVGTNLPSVSDYTEEGDVSAPSTDWTVDNGTIIAPVVGIGNYVAGQCDATSELYLVSPEMDFSTFTASPMLTFRYFLDNGIAAGAPGLFATLNLDVVYKESAGGAWSTVATYTTISDSWNDETVDLSGASDYSTFYIGFRIYGVVTSTVNWGYMGLDEIVVTAEPGCSNSTSSFDAEGCFSYTVPSGDETYTVSGTVMDTIPNTEGCDSIMTINVTITEPDVTVTESGGTLSAAATGVGYQWIDCSDLSPIAGATSADFTPTQDGEYAVIIDEGGCVDTSECSTIFGLQLDETQHFNARIFPNPTNGLVQVQLSNQHSFSRIELRSIEGKLLFNQIVTEQELIQLDLSHFENGTYLVRLLTDEEGYVSQVLVKE